MTTTKARTGAATVDAPTHPAQEVDHFAATWTKLWNKPHIADAVGLNHRAQQEIDEDDAIDDLLQQVAGGLKEWTDWIPNSGFECPNESHPTNYLRRCASPWAKP